VHVSTKGYAGEDKQVQDPKKEDGFDKRIDETVGKQGSHGMLLNWNESKRGVVPYL
jgi:hypothetical protein